MKNQQKNVPIVSYTFMSRFNNDLVQLQARDLKRNGRLTNDNLFTKNKRKQNKSRHYDMSIGTFDTFFLMKPMSSIMISLYIRE